MTSNEDTMTTPEQSPDPITQAITALTAPAPVACNPAVRPGKRAASSGRDARCGAVVVQWMSGRDCPGTSTER